MTLTGCQHEYWTMHVLGQLQPKWTWFCLAPSEALAEGNGGSAMQIDHSVKMGTSYQNRNFTYLPFLTINMIAIPNGPRRSQLSGARISGIAIPFVGRPPTATIIASHVALP